MRRISTGLLAALVLASACVPAPATKSSTPKPKASGSAASPSPKPRASGASASTSPSPAVALDPARLTGGPGLVPLGGVVRVDAAYMVAAGAGNVLSHNGAQIVAAGGGNVLSHNGGQLVAAGGLNLVAAGGLNLVAAGAGNLVAAGGGNLVAAGAGNIVAAGGGNIVAAGAGNLISDDGSTLIGADGGSLIGVDGGTLVAAGAGNIVAAGAGNMVAAGAGNIVAAGAGNLVAAGAGNFTLLGFGLAQAASPAPTGPAPAFGTELPAAGMLVWVKSLKTGNPVPVGRGPDGEPAWAVFTDAAGRYDLHVPADLAGTVMVVAEPPYRNDRRTYYAQIGARSGEEGRIDEDEALVTRYARLSGRTRFDYFLLPFLKAGGLTSEQALRAAFASFAEDGNVDPLVLEPLLAPVMAIGEALRTNPHITDDPKTPQDDRDERFRRVAEDMVDVLLADQEAYDAIRTQPFDVDAYFARKLHADRPDEAALLAEIQGNPLHQAIKAEGLSAFGALRRILADVRAATTRMGPEQAKAFAASNLMITRANAFHAKYDPPHVPRPYYTFAKPTDLADFLVTEYLAHPINAPYGCRDDRGARDCDQAYPKGATTCDPRANPATCFPAEGFTKLRTSYIEGYMHEVLQAAGLPRTHGDLLYAAGEAFATATLPYIALKQAELVHVACRFGRGPNPPCPAP